jgi:hypothetical protein
VSYAEASAWRRRRRRRRRRRSEEGGVGEAARSTVDVCFPRTLSLCFAMTHHGIDNQCVMCVCILQRERERERERERDSYIFIHIHICI